MTFKLGQQRKPIPHTPGVKELAPLSITTTPLNPIITNFLGLHHHTSTGTTTTTTTAAPAAAPRVVEIGLRRGPEKPELSYVRFEEVPLAWCEFAGDSLCRKGHG